MNREARKNLAAQTLEILDRGWYEPRPGFRVDIGDVVTAATENTRLFIPDALQQVLKDDIRTGGVQTLFMVSNETTLAAASTLDANGFDRVLALNFASARNPGGGFLSGSQAQEESLARSSALYPTLLAAPDYYDINRNCGTGLYTDHMILSPNVPVFYNDTGMLLDRPYRVSFLTAPAVNAGAVRKNEPKRIGEIIPTMRRRIAMVLDLAAREGYRHLILGAWGCGVFRNDPAQIAALFAEQLLGDGRHVDRFERVSFSVLDRQDRGIIGPFENVFAGVLNGA